MYALIRAKKRGEIISLSVWVKNEDGDRFREITKTHNDTKKKESE
jgi:hypothetical protein